MRAERNVHLVFVSDEDLVNIGRTWATASLSIAGAIAVAAISITLMLVMDAKAGLRWEFYGGQSLLAGLNLLRAGYVAWRQVRIEKNRRLHSDPANERRN